MLIDLQHGSLSHSIRQSIRWETLIVMKRFVISLESTVCDESKVSIPARLKAVVDRHVRSKHLKERHLKIIYAMPSLSMLSEVL
jgi:hypothetical protein